MIAPSLGRVAYLAAALSVVNESVASLELEIERPGSEGSERAMPAGAPRHERHSGDDAVAPFAEDGAAKGSSKEKARGPRKKMAVETPAPGPCCLGRPIDLCVSLCEGGSVCVYDETPCTRMF